MKILIFPILLAFLLLAFYLLIHKPKTQKPKSAKNIRLLVVIFLIILIVFLGFKFLNSINAPDTQCTMVHATNSLPPKSLDSPKDYFNQGNYDYDIGNCRQAIADYSKAIQLKPEFPESYNNRAYTYMRMQDYKNALPDLDKAIILKPTYVQALMNRGDLFNYYGPIINRQKAILDYEKVISLGALRKTSVCGHLFLAKHNGWNLGTILDFPRVVLGSCE